MGSSSNGTSGYEPIDPNAPPSSLGGKLTIALIVGFILMILCIMFISVILSVRRAVHDAAETSPKRQRTWLKQLNKTAASTAFSKWARSHGQNHPGLDLDQPICAICLETIQAKEEVRGLQCSHVFHRVCLESWVLGNHPICPICRRGIDLATTPHSNSWRLNITLFRNPVEQRDTDMV